MNCTRRMLAASGLAALAGLGALAAHAQAQTYPTRSITMIVPFAAGGPTDVDLAHRHRAYGARRSARASSSRTWSAPAAPPPPRARARAANDGYTLITGHMGTHARVGAALSQPRLPSRKGFRAGRAVGRHADPDPGAQGFSRRRISRNSSAYVKANVRARSTRRMPASARSRMCRASC